VDAPIGYCQLGQRIGAVVGQRYGGNAKAFEQPLDEALGKCLVLDHHDVQMCEFRLGHVATAMEPLPGLTLQWSRQGCRFAIGEADGPRRHFTARLT